MTLPPINDDLLFSVFEHLILPPPPPTHLFERENFVEWHSQRTTLRLVNKQWKIVSQWARFISKHLDHPQKLKGFRVLHNVMKGKFRLRSAQAQERQFFLEFLETDFQKGQNRVVKEDHCTYRYQAGLDQIILETIRFEDPIQGQIKKTEMHQLAFFPAPIMSLALLPNHLALSTNQHVYLVSRKTKEIRYSLPVSSTPKGMMSNQEQTHLLIEDQGRIKVFDFANIGEEAGGSQSLCARWQDQQVYLIKSIAKEIIHFIRNDFIEIIKNCAKFMVSLGVITALAGLTVSLLFGMGLGPALILTMAVATLFFLVFAAGTCAARLRAKIQLKWNQIHDPFYSMLE